MRFLLASSGLGAVAVMLASPVMAETVISTAQTTPVTTGTLGDIRISSTGSVKPTGGAAVTINSNNYVKNEGAIAITGANDSVGILGNTNLTGDISNSGTITIDENFTPTDSDSDGDLDGPFAQGSNRFGIHVLGGGTYTGNIVNSGTITVEGNQSAGIAIDSALTGSLTSTKAISVVGNDSVGIRTGAVSGNVTIGSGSTTQVQGQNAVGLLFGGDIGGALVIQGTVATTGYRTTTRPADTSKLDADDLLQGGSAVVVAGDVAKGILLESKSGEGSATLTSFGAAPALAIGSSSEDIHIGSVPGSDFGIFNKGAVSGLGVYQGVSATGVKIGGTGHAVNVDVGLGNTGTISATASGASATALNLASGALVPQIVNAGSIRAEGGSASGGAATAVLIESGATVNVLTNSGNIVATRTGDSGPAAAILDKSGTLALVVNSGQIGVTNASALGEAATAIDLRARSTGAVIRQVDPVAGRPAPLISGNIYFGTGNDSLIIESGSVVGRVSFGGGADKMSVTNHSLFRGTIFGSPDLAVVVGAGSTLDVQNQGTVNLASIVTDTGANLGVTIGDAGHTLYAVSGTAFFATGTKVLVTIGNVGSAAGTYTIIDAGTLTGAENLSSSIVTLPFLFNSSLSTDAAAGEVDLHVTRKSASELGLNRSETAILNAALDASDSDKSVSAVFLSVANSDTLKDTLQQMLPEHAGGAFETATKGTRLAAEILSAPRTVNGLWLQEVAWGSSKSIGDTSGYDLSSWGTTGGYDIPLGAFGSVGLTAGYFYGKDSEGRHELGSHHYEGGAYWRGAFGPVRGWARATAATIDFKSQRDFSGTITGGDTVVRSAKGKWKGKLYSASAGLSYEARMGRLSLRPNATVEYYKLDEDGYSETGGGDAFDLIVRSHKSNETAATAMLSVGYDLIGSGGLDDGWLRLELAGGRREILSSKIGHTVASFGDGTPFTLEAEDRTSGWRGAARVLAGGSTMSFNLEANAEEQEGRTGLGGRLGINLAL